MPERARESGAALIVALIFLLLMTLLSTASMRTSTMQERMAGNQRDWNIGFQSAEAALREGEDYLLNEDDLPEFNDTGGFYQINSSAAPAWASAPLAEGAGVLDVAIEDLPTAHYYVEKLSSIRPAGVSTETGTPVEEIYYFRITAVGYGAAVDDDGDPITAVVLRSVYRSR
ncbi:MAG TPA: PilX N-terminal domain-containing pilus assembly protein [Woeseiaceae bacterium]